MPPQGIKCTTLHPSLSYFPHPISRVTSPLHTTWCIAVPDEILGETSSTLPRIPCLHFLFRYWSRHMWEHQPLDLLVWGRKWMSMCHF
jgi:hypothetical protein